MTNDELECRIALLKAELDDLRLRDARRESEHTGMLRTRDLIAEQLHDEHAREYAMLAEASDKRIAEIIAGVAAKDEAEGKVAVDASLFVTAVLDVINALFERQRRFETIAVKRIAELTASVDAGTKNEATFTEAFKELGARLVDLEREMLGAHEMKVQLDALENATRKVLSTVVAIRDAARRNKPPRDPGTPPVN